jgi:hypothetical protein
MVALLKRVLAASLFQANRSHTESDSRDHVPMLAYSSALKDLQAGYTWVVLI